MIMQTPDNQIIKHIYHRKGLSSSKFKPYALRFVKNSRVMLQRGFIVPTVKHVFRFNESNCDVLIYDFLEGKCLRECDQTVLVKIPEFIKKLHSDGIYFRDLHFGNIIVHHDQFAIVDLASANIKKRPLSTRERARNLAHLFNDFDDKKILASYGKELFLTQYFSAAKLRPWQIRLFHYFFNRRVK